MAHLHHCAMLCVFLSANTFICATKTQNCEQQEIRSGSHWQCSPRQCNLS